MSDKSMLMAVYIFLGLLITLGLVNAYEGNQQRQHEALMKSLECEA